MWPFKTKSTEPAETKSLTDPESESWGALGGLYTSSSGIAVNADVAMRVPAVNAAVTLIATSVATLPCKVYRRTTDGKEADDGHDAYALVHDEANDWQSAGKVRELVTMDALLHGDGFGFVVKGGGKPKEVVHLPRDKVVVERENTGEPRYRIGQDVYGPDRIIHVQAPSIDGGLSGLGLVRAGREAIGLAILLERTSTRLFRNNSRPGGVLSFKGKLNVKTVERIAESWRSAHGGDKAGGIAVMDQDGNYTPISFTSVESQHQEQRNFAIGEIARLTRVPVTMLQELSKGTLQNVEQQALQFLQLCLLPWLKAWTDAYRRTLLSKEERRTHTIDFVVDDLLRADTATRAEAYAKFRSMGSFTANDVRRRENMPSLPDGNSLASPYTTPANSNTPRQEDAA